MPLLHGPTDRSPLSHPPRRADGTTIPSDTTTSPLHPGRPRPYIRDEPRTLGPAEAGRGKAQHIAVMLFATAVLLIAPGAEAETPGRAVCDDSAILDGPRVAPVGAVEVQPGQQLGELTDSHPAGTTFWLAPGIHVLTDSEYDQVEPKDGNTYVGAPGAVLDGRDVNFYAFGQGGEDVTISHLTIRRFTPPHQEGVVNKDSASGWTIEYSTIEDNRGAGVMGGTGLVVRSSCLRDNGQYGANVYRLDDGQTDITFVENEIVGNNTDDWENRVEGCGCSGGVKFWAATGVTFVDNWVHDNRGVGIWADTNNADFLIEGNVIEDNDAAGFFYETSYNAVVRDNVFRRNVLVDGPANPGFPNAAVYLSEAGGDPRAPGPPTIEVVDNVFEDNWNGVTLWENADRFCGSPANTSTGYCTIATEFEQCTREAIAEEPNISDCRWKTQNVTVAGNRFSFDRSDLECELCGVNSIISNYGTWPEWHPYQGSTIQEAVTTSQNNQFEDNGYHGDWKFIHFDQATILSFDEWQREAAQDRSSLRVDSAYTSQPAIRRRTPTSWSSYL